MEQTDDRTGTRTPSARAGLGAATAANLPFLLISTVTENEAAQLVTAGVMVATFVVGLCTAIGTTWRRFGVGLAFGTIGLLVAYIALVFAFLVIFVAPHLS